MGLSSSFYETILVNIIPSSKGKFKASPVFKQVDFIDYSKFLFKEMDRILSVIDILELDQTQDFNRQHLL